MLDVDDSKNSTKAIDYAVRMYSKIRNLRYTLFNIIGRSGMNRSFFMGSVSRYVINRTMNRALWVVS